MNEGKDNSATVVGGSVDATTIRLSPASFSGACSALAHMFIESSISKEFNDTRKELWTKLSGYTKGTRRMGGNEKCLHGLSTNKICSLQIPGKNFI